MNTISSLFGYFGLEARFVVQTTACLLASVLLSTLVIRLGLSRIRTGPPPDSQGARSLGFWIGLSETVLAFVFVFHGEFGALAIIFAAKEFVRKEAVAKDPAYFLLGTLANLAIAVVFALIAQAMAAK